MCETYNGTLVCLVLCQAYQHLHCALFELCCGIQADGLLTQFDSLTHSVKKGSYDITIIQSNMFLGNCYYGDWLCSVFWDAVARQ